LRGQYSADSGSRPRHTGGPDGNDDRSARLFLCARCRTQVVICRCCDRGQIYCPDGCAQQARQASCRASARRYQRSRAGRFAHAERSRRYRARQKIVTHQGSPTAPTDVHVDPGAERTSSAVVAAPCPALASRPQRASGRDCHWCGCPCPRFLRQDFLTRPRAVRTRLR
jgi:hypothetical protein